VSPRAATALFALAGPGLELGVGPALLTGGLRRGDGVLDHVPVTVAGAVLLVAALAVVVWCLVDLAGRGGGSPSPAAPTRRLVVAGPYRHVRHPMYAATTAGLAGEALLLAQPVLLVAALVYRVALGLWAARREEPLLARRFGTAWEAYRATVPGWLPRVQMPPHFWGCG
jgi:protein-S-isoprenylcysteine O-methyltransferase Ste14